MTEKERCLRYGLLWRTAYKVLNQRRNGQLMLPMHAYAIRPFRPEEIVFTEEGFMCFKTHKEAESWRVEYYPKHALSGYENIWRFDTYKVLVRQIISEEKDQEGREIIKAREMMVPQWASFLNPDVIMVREMGSRQRNGYQVSPPVYTESGGVDVRTGGWLDVELRRIFVGADERERILDWVADGVDCEEVVRQNRGNRALIANDLLQWFLSKQEAKEDLRKGS